jgi:hypothetical protein
MTERPKRRRLLAAGLAGAAALGGGAAYLKYFRKPSSTEGIRVEGAALAERRVLGRTGLPISVLGIGAGGIRETAILARAADLGMNYIDTAICYGDSEDVIGRAFSEHPGLRDKLVLATKWDPAANTPKSAMISSLDRSLKRMGTDRIDVMQIHWLGGGHRGLAGDDGFNRLDNPELYAAMEEAKRSGKVRFFGATSHDANRSKILRHAIAKGSFDMILVKMNILDFEDAEMPALLDAAKEANVGVVVMKSQPEGGTMPPGFDGSKYSAFQANLRWVLSHHVTSIVHSDFGTSAEAQDVGVGAVQEPLSARDAELLERYAEAMSPHYCRGCEGRCHDACPDGVVIGSVLRARLYATAYGWPERAEALYTRLPEAGRFSDRCASCSACSEACPFGVDAAGRVRDARSIFS